MYVPYLYTKTFELSAIKELLQKNIIKKDLVCPLLSSYSTRGLRSAIELFIKNEYPIFLVLNPDYKFADSFSEKDFDDIKSMAFGDNSIIPTYWITNEIDNLEIEKLNTLTKDYAIIHGNLLPDEFEENINDNVYRIYIDNNLDIDSEKDIEIVDGFIKEEKSDDYKKFSTFNSRIFSYIRRGLYAFGDYQTIGRKIPKGGAAPNFIVINIIYKMNKKLYIRHFKSNEKIDHATTDPLPIKFKYVLDVISEEIEEEKEKYIMTEGLTQLLNLKDHFPGLGKLKQFSIMHHIEFMQKELELQNGNK
ncbi:sce7725 family protein [Brachyspira murdochii]|uniref:Uncharacterized protein n=1 Tax=Brachyspira murdochii TaxID=84378 RepID=A0ABX5B643_9SPIR|nr:sce7725 family protein [Brachyspira murdochii]PPS22696.1 hypothetical protein DJ52_03370 [Brachyspira murdochii]